MWETENNVMKPPKRRHHQELSSQLITHKSQIFPFNNSDLQYSGLDGLVAESSVFKTKQFWNLLSSNLRFWVSFNLLSSQRLIFSLPKNHVTPFQKYFNCFCIEISDSNVLITVISSCKKGGQLRYKNDQTFVILQ